MYPRHARQKLVDANSPLQLQICAGYTLIVPIQISFCTAERIFFKIASKTLDQLCIYIPVIINVTRSTIHATFNESRLSL